MTNQPKPDLEFCESCSLILEDGAIHADQGICIQAMQVAMLNQKKAAEGLSYALSTKYLEVLEILCVEHGAEFAKVRDVYIAMGDWSPMKLLQEELQAEQALNAKMEGYLQTIHSSQGLPLTSLPSEFIEELERFLFPEVECQPLPDLDGS